MLPRLVLGKKILASSLVRTAIHQFPGRDPVVRQFARDTRDAVKTRTKPTLKERIMAPAGPKGNELNKTFYSFASRDVFPFVFYALRNNYDIAFTNVGSDMKSLQLL